MARRLADIIQGVILSHRQKEQARFPFRPLSEIKKHQSRHVRAAVGYAYRYVPYYREAMNRLGLRPGDFRTADDLTQLPVLRREHLRRDAEYYVSTASPPTSYFRIDSSGSTGTPRSIFYDRDCLLQSSLHSERGLSVIAAALGHPDSYSVAVVVSPYGVMAKFARLAKPSPIFYPPSLPVRQQYLSVFDPIEKSVAQINDFKPDVILSMGSYFEAFFAHLQSAGGTLHLPKVIVYSFDGLSNSARRLIGGTYPIAIFSAYKATEALNIAFECPQHIGLHLNIDLYPVRIVDADGAPLPDGQYGNVVVSNLVNRGTVLLNYHLSDTAAILTEHCSCGRTLPLLSFPEGRSDDYLELACGRIVHPQQLMPVFAKIEQVWQYQVVQKNPDRIHVAVIPTEGCDRRQTEWRITTEFRRVLGDDVSVEVEFVRSINRTQGGKVRTVLSQCRMPRAETAC